MPARLRRLSGQPLLLHVRLRRWERRKPLRAGSPFGDSVRQLGGCGPCSRTQRARPSRCSVWCTLAVHVPPPALPRRSSSTRRRGERGAILKHEGRICQWFATKWAPDDVKDLPVKIGDSGSQTFWEFATLVLAMTLWGHQSAESRGQGGLTILGDNTGALGDALALKGRGPMLALARELAWRKARYGWQYSVAHLPAEHNRQADALSRLHAPEPCRVPAAMHEGLEAIPPKLSSIWVM